MGKFRLGDYVRLKYVTVEVENYFIDQNCFSIISDEIDMKEGESGYPNAWDHGIYISANHVMWDIKKSYKYELDTYSLNGSMSCVKTNLRYDTRRRAPGYYTYINKVDFTKNVEMDDILYVVNTDPDFSKNGIYYLIPSESDYENMYSPYAQDALFSTDDIKKGLVSSKKYIKEKSSKKTVYNNLGVNFIGVTYSGEAFWGKVVGIYPIFEDSFKLTIEMSDGIIWHVHSSHLETYNPNVQGIEIFHASNNKKLVEEKEQAHMKEEVENPPRGGGWEFD